MTTQSSSQHMYHGNEISVVNVFSLHNSRGKQWKTTLMAHSPWSESCACLTPTPTILRGGQSAKFCQNPPPFFFFQNKVGCPPRPYKKFKRKICSQFRDIRQNIFDPIGPVLKLQKKQNLESGVVLLCWILLHSRITWQQSCGHVCKMFGRRWTNEAKIAIFNYPIFNWQRTPANICINLIRPETTFPGLHLCRWQYMGSSANFRRVLSVSRRRQPISCRAQKQILTQNGHLRSFKVIYFGIIEEPLMCYIVQYNKCGLTCKGSEDIASKRSENLYFRPPHSHLTPHLQWNPANICITLTLLETRIPGLHSCCW